MRWIKGPPVISCLTVLRRNGLWEFMTNKARLGIETQPGLVEHWAHLEKDWPSDGDDGWLAGALLDPCQTIVRRWIKAEMPASVNRRASVSDHCACFFVEVGGFAVPLLGVS